MHSPSTSWDSLVEQGRRIESLLPEVQGRIIPLLRAMASAERIGAPLDHRLMGVDLDNLLQSAERAAAFRQEGMDSETLRESLRGINRLASSMHTRTHTALRTAQEELSLHARTAAEGLEDSQTNPTESFPTSALLPIPDEGAAPCATGLDTAAQLGQVTGDFFHMDTRTTRTVAGHASWIVPKRHKLELAPGQAALLHTQGIQAGPHAGIPSESSFGTTLIFAGPKGATISGPAVIEPSEDGARFFTSMLNHKDSITTHERFKKRMEFWIMFFGLGAMGAFVLFTSMAVVATFPETYGAKMTTLASMVGYAVLFMGIFAGLAWRNAGRANTPGMQVLERESQPFLDRYMKGARAQDLDLQRFVAHAPSQTVLSFKPASYVCGAPRTLRPRMALPAPPTADRMPIRPSQPKRLASTVHES